MYLLAVHFLDGLDGHRLLHILYGRQVRLVVGSLCDFDAEDEPELFKELLQLGLGGFAGEVVDYQAGVVLHIFFVPGLVVDLDFLAENLLVVHHLDSLET